jgi:hypothetical protein
MSDKTEKVLKKTQVDGKKYELPAEDVEIQKLVKKGISLSGKLAAVNAELDTVKLRLAEIGTSRREGSTTVSLKGVTGKAVVTFREVTECKASVADIRHELGSLWDRFFKKEVRFKPLKDLKGFLNGEHAHGVDCPAVYQNLIREHLSVKTYKPSVRFTAAKSE